MRHSIICYTINVLLLTERTDTMVEEKSFLAFVAGIFEVPAESLSLDTAYESIPVWDSVMQLRLTLEIGAEYNIDIPVDEIADIKTLAGFYKYVNV